MILNIIAFKNEKIEAFTNPHYIDVEPEKAAVQLARSMKVEPDKATPYQNLTMWFLGTFDDETGSFDVGEPEMLLDCRKVWKELKDAVICTDNEKVEA